MKTSFSKNIFAFFQIVHADGQGPCVRHPRCQPSNDAEDAVQVGAVGQLGTHSAQARVQRLLQAGRPHLQHQRRKSESNLFSNLFSIFIY